MNVFLLLSALTVFSVDPWSNKAFLPDADPKGGVVTSDFSLAAAQGEFEAMSFVVNPDGDYEQVDVVPSDLVGPGGARIPAEAADVALVKVWFQASGRWNSSWRGDPSHPSPMNTLVLHDDSLVKVDWEKKVNYLRADYVDGSEYLNVSRRDRQTHFEHDLEPVRDAPKFVPFDLKKGFRQQYLITWKVPKDAKPGDYKGTITLSTPNSRLSTLNLSLEVYPFALPRPRTHYDTSEPYLSYWMGSPSLDGLLAGGYRLDRAEKKLRAIFRNMADHNAINLSGVGALKTDSTDDYALRTLLIARQEGMCADGLINGMSIDISGGFAWNTEGNLREPEKEPERYQKSLNVVRSAVMAQNAILDKYLGHHRCYYQSVDECDESVNRRSYGYWSVIHGLGGRTWTDYAAAEKNGVFVDMNDMPSFISPTRAWDWRASGAKSVTYSATFTGVENPGVWRRTKGIRFWYADFDGQHEYSFFDGGKNRWNDFAHPGSYCQFGIVYWTIDGLVSTLAWEAMREALDDVRYFTLLRLRAEAALKSDDPETRKLGRRALAWQDGVDPEYVIDLNAFRRKTASVIKLLIAKVGPQPADVDTELPPPATIPEDSRWQNIPKPPEGAEKILSYAEKESRGNRYDLALAALEAIVEETTADASDRVKAAMEASVLHSRMKERSAAVAILDKMLSVGCLKGADRGKLLLARANALMTDAKFEEVQTVRQLDEAAKTIAEEQKFPCGSEKVRGDAICRMTRGYFLAEDVKKAIAYAEARLKDSKIPKATQVDLLILEGRSYAKLEDWNGSLKAFAKAHAVNGNDKDVVFRRKILGFEAWVSERAKDYERAAKCWMDMILTYDSVDQKGAIDNAKRNAARLTELARKNMKVPVQSDDDAGISLDE